MLQVMCCFLNIYAAAGNQGLSEDVQWQKKERVVKKQPGCTWVEVNNKVHTFVRIKGRLRT
jgi:hypothetical protein